MMLPVRKWSVFMWMGLALLANGLTAQPVSRDKSDRSIFHAGQFENIYKPHRQEFYGVFGSDTPQSYFLVRTAGIRVADMANIHKVQGRNWHMGVVTRFTGENRILHTGPADSTIIDHLNFGPEPSRIYDSLRKTGWVLYKAEGQFLYREDSTAQHSGILKGVFSVIFLYNDKEYRVASVPAGLWLLEPELVFTGTWNPYEKPESWLHFFWSSLDPAPLPQGGFMLPDFRIREKGGIHSGKSVYLAPDLQEPGADW